MLKAAVVGCGRMGAGPSSRLEGQVPAGWLPSAHAEALRGVDGIRLVALCDTDAETLARAATQYGVNRTYVDYHELIAREQPDLLAIATRTPEKSGVLRAAVAGGVRGVYVEKPLATSVGSARALLDDAARAGVVVSYGVNRRFHAVYRHARAWLAEGVIGDVRDITVELGRSMLLWTHPHSVDLILWFARGSVVTGLQALLDPASVRRDSELLIDSDPLVEHAHFRFESGLCGTIVRVGGLGVRLGGSDGVMTVHANGAFIEVRRRQQPSSPYFMEVQTHLPASPESATVTAIRELAAAITTGASPGITASEILAGTQMLIGCAWSHVNGGAVVDLSSIPEKLVVSGRSGERYA